MRVLLLAIIFTTFGFNQVEQIYKRDVDKFSINIIKKKRSYNQAKKVCEKEYGVFHGRFVDKSKLLLSIRKVYSSGIYS